MDTIINVKADNRLKALNAIKKTKKGFVKAVISTKNNPQSCVTTSFDYLWSYCLGYYNFTVTITQEA